MWTEKMTALLGDPVLCKVTIEEFYKDIWSLHARGNFEDSYINLELKLRRNILLPSTNLLTFGLVKEKWQAYIKEAERTRTEARFIRGFQSWMDAQGYLENYGPLKRKNLFPGV